MCVCYPIVAVGADLYVCMYVCMYVCCTYV